MSKRILITSTDVMMLQFLVPHAFHLQTCGYEVEVAVSNVEGHVEELKEIFKDKTKFSIVDLVRSPFSLKNRIGFSQLKTIIREGNYDVIWTNEPVMGVMTRRAAKKVKSKAKIIYVAHGFHFYKGAPLKNWLLFYTIEKWMSRITNEIITINNEDYQRAKKRFKKPKIFHMKGIGINTRKFHFDYTHQEILAKRKEIGVSPEDTLFISVGELEKRKNHFTAIKAFKKANIPNSKLIICGVGTQEKKLKAFINKNSLDDRVSLLGYRYDIKELCCSADVFLFVTYQEGLSVALMEAMAIGIPCVISRIRGNVDLIDEDKGVYCNPKDYNSCAEAIVKCFSNLEYYKNCAAYNREKLADFDFEKVKLIMAHEIEGLTMDKADK